MITIIRKQAIQEELSVLNSGYLVGLSDSGASEKKQRDGQSPTSQIVNGDSHRHPLKNWSRD
jgi:hypothetical protein